MTAPYRSGSLEAENERLRAKIEDLEEELRHETARRAPKKPGNVRKWIDEHAAELIVGAFILATVLLCVFFELRQARSDCSEFANDPVKDVPVRCLKEFGGRP